MLQRLPRPNIRLSKTLFSPSQQRLCTRRYISTAETVLNPRISLLAYLEEKLKSEWKSAGSVLIACTPNHAMDLVELIRSEKFRECAQIAGVVLDAVPFGAQRDGWSTLVCETQFDIVDAKPLEDGPPPVPTKTGRTNWTLDMGMFSLDIVILKGTKADPPVTPGATSNSYDDRVEITELVIPTANTLFDTASQSTMLFNNAGSSSSSKFKSLENYLLSALKIKLPITWNGEDIRRCVSLTSIDQADPNPLIVTSASENMLKTINKRPAAQFLERSKSLMSQVAKDESASDRKVFVEIVSSSQKSSTPDSEGSSNTNTSMFEVIAGGGGTWSPRSSMLVVEPPAVLRRGDVLSFYLSRAIKSQDQYANSEHPKHIERMEASETPVNITLECAPIQEHVSLPCLHNYGEHHVISNRFGMSSEHGFLIDGKKHSVNGETISILRA